MGKYSSLNIAHFCEVLWNMYIFGRHVPCWEEWCSRCLVDLKLDYQKFQIYLTSRASFFLSCHTALRATISMIPDLRIRRPYKLKKGTNGVKLRTCQISRILSIRKGEWLIRRDIPHQIKKSSEIIQCKTSDDKRRIIDRLSRLTVSLTSAVRKWSQASFQHVKLK